MVGSSWTAILTIVRHSPANADVIRKNPLGICIDAIDWSRELEPAPQPAPAAQPAPVADAASASPDISQSQKEILP